jgi:hypothetical protein
MNYYIVVEGKTEKPVYVKWIPLVNKKLSYVDDLDKIKNNNFFIVSGGGSPFYFNVIEDAIEDVNSLDIIDCLVIAVDSEEMTKKEKFDEITDFVKEKSCIKPVKIIVQHFCIETWALGNKKIVKRYPADSILREYRAYFDILTSDPETMPGYPSENLKRAKFAYKYLKKNLAERFTTITYTKKNPVPLLHPTYFKEVRNRIIKTGHIASFQDFLDAF